MPYILWAKEEIEALRKMWPLYLACKIDLGDMRKVLTGRRESGIRQQGIRMGLPVRGNQGMDVNQSELAKLLGKPVKI